MFTALVVTSISITSTTLPHGRVVGVNHTLRGRACGSCWILLAAFSATSYTRSFGRSDVVVAREVANKEPQTRTGRRHVPCNMEPTGHAAKT